MSPAALLDQVRSLGAAVTAARGSLHVKVLAGVLTPELRTGLRHHKPELLVLIDKEAVEKSTSGRLCDSETGLVRPESIDGLAHVDRSCHVGEHAGAENPVDNALVVYCEAELLELAGKTSEELRAIHAVKQVFDGEIFSDADDDSSAPSERTKCRKGRD